MNIRPVVAGLMQDIADLLIQYDPTEAGRQFIAAWRNARIIDDADHGPGEEEELPTADPSAFRFECRFPW